MEKNNKEFIETIIRVLRVNYALFGKKAVTEEELKENQRLLDVIEQGEELLNTSTSEFLERPKSLQEVLPVIQQFKSDVGE